MFSCRCCSNKELSCFVISIGSVCVIGVFITEVCVIPSLFRLDKHGINSAPYFVANLAAEIGVLHIRPMNGNFVPELMAWSAIKAIVSPRCSECIICLMPSLSFGNKGNPIFEILETYIRFRKGLESGLYKLPILWPSRTNRPRIES